MIGLLLHVLRLAVLLGCGWRFAASAAPGRSLLPTLALAHLAGAAAVGAGLTAGLVVTGRVSAEWAIGGVLLLALLGLALPRRAGAPPPLPAPSPPVPQWVTWTLAACVAVGLLTAAARVVLLPLDWDGWAIWQFKALALVQGNLRGLLQDPQYVYSHPDYPLLLPAHTAWLCGERFDPKVAQVGGFLFLLDLLVLFYDEARRRTSPHLALAGCAVILSWPLTMKHAASGFADIPMAAYTFGTVVFLARGELRAMAACLVGALLTKNEGLFTLAAALLIALLWTPAAAAGSARGRRAAVVLVVGVVTAGAWAIVKRRWGLVADLLDPARWPRDLLALLPRRALVTAGGFLREALRVGPHYPGWGLLWPLAGVALVLSIRRRLRETAPFWMLAGVHFAGAAAAYLVTGTDSGLHLSRSLDRLWLHVAPAVLLATLMALAPDAGDGEGAG